MFKYIYKNMYIAKFCAIELKSEFPMGMLLPANTGNF